MELMEAPFPDGAGRPSGSRRPAPLVAIARLSRAGVYHLRDCRRLLLSYPGGFGMELVSVESAERLGLRPCRNCQG